MPVRLSSCRRRHPRSVAPRRCTRTGRRLLLALTLSLCALPGPAVADTDSPPAPDYTAEPPRLVDTRWLSDRMVDLTFATPQLSPPLARASVRVLLPRGWRSTDRRYPAVYLLHGAGDRYTGWTTKHDGWPVGLAEFTADKDVAVLMPDGGTPDSPGWYSDWFNDGAYGPPRWETFHIAQLLPYLQSRFPLRTDRDGRVVAGLSMGGFGALSYAARHPDLFAGAFSLSGAVDTRQLGDAFPRVWGDQARQEVRIRGHNPTDLVRNLRHTTVWLRTGGGLPGGPAPEDNNPGALAIEAAVWEMNERFVEAAEAAAVPYSYQEYARGAHNWWHWHRGLQRFAWPAIEATFARDTPVRPARFSYRSTEPVFRAWDWRVTVQRRVTEFLRMREVTDDRLRLTGSGTVRLTTPPVHSPGTQYTVEVAGRTAATSTPLVTADPDGRLHLTVRLGPSHQHQQYTPAQRAASAAAGQYWQHATVQLRRHG